MALSERWKWYDKHQILSSLANDDWDMVAQFVLFCPWSCMACGVRRLISKHGLGKFISTSKVRISFNASEREKLQNIVCVGVSIVLYCSASPPLPYQNTCNWLSHADFPHHSTVFYPGTEILSCFSLFCSQKRKKKDWMAQKVWCESQARGR